MVKLLFFDLDETLIAKGSLLYNQNAIEKNKDLIHLVELERGDLGKFNLITSKKIIELLHNCTENENVHWYIISRGGNVDFLPYLKNKAHSLGKNIEPNGTVFAHNENNFSKGDTIVNIIEENYKSKGIDFEGYFLDERKDEREDVKLKLSELKVPTIKENGFTIKEEYSNKTNDSVTVNGVVFTLEDPYDGPDGTEYDVVGPDGKGMGSCLGNCRRITWFSPSITLITNKIADELIKFTKSKAKKSDSKSKKSDSKSELSEEDLRRKIKNRKDTLKLFREEGRQGAQDMIKREILDLSLQLQQIKKPVEPKVDTSEPKVETSEPEVERSEPKVEVPSSEVDTFKAEKGKIKQSNNLIFLILIIVVILTLSFGFVTFNKKGGKKRNTK